MRHVLIGGKLVEHQPLSGAERDAIVASKMREHLAALGLTEISAKTWVDGSKAPVRRLFELQLLKGASMKACWGWSLDFVPHISGGRVRWHRSDKTARLDLVIDPVGLPQPSFYQGPARLAESLEDLLAKAVARAQQSWRRGDSLHGMLEILREIRDPRTNENIFGFYNYTQLPLAYSFLSAKTGDLHTAEEELKAYINQHDLDEEEAEKLQKLAREYSQG